MNPPKKKTACPVRGLTAVVTGGSSGIGRAIAHRLAVAGANVFVHGGHDREQVLTTLSDIRRSNVEAAGVTLDLHPWESQEELVDRAWQWRGMVDIWVNAAGVDVLTGAAARWSFEEKLQALWEVDVLATMRISRLVGDRMRKQQGDRMRKQQGSIRPAIVNIGWDQAATGMEGDSGEMFAATKGAVTAFSLSLAKTLAPQVRVNCVAPGWIRTKWGQGATEAWQQRAARESLSNRWGTPQDVAEVVAFVASPAADFVNGQIVAVNGGFAGRGNPLTDDGAEVASSP